MPQEPADDPVRIVGSIRIEGEVVDFASVRTGALIDADGLVGEHLVADVRGREEFFALGAV
jgi:hypothetical protein